MKLTIVKETRNEEGELVELPHCESEWFSPRELYEFLKFNLFCGYPSATIDLKSGADNTTTYLTDNTVSDGDRDCIEKGFCKTLSIHYEAKQDTKNKKYWNILLRMLDRHDRLAM